MKTIRELAHEAGWEDMFIASDDGGNDVDRDTLCIPYGTLDSSRFCVKTAGGVVDVQRLFYRG
jgi:hypothetical protein